MEQVKKSNKWLMMVSVLLSSFLSSLDGSIVNVALPVMAESLHVDTARIQLVATSYLVVIVGVILIFGKLGDMIGKSRIFYLGIAVFTIGSLLCGVATSFEFLIVARIIEAIGAAGTMANNQGIITEIFPASERGKALGLIGTSVALGSLIGPGLGGIMISFLPWQSLFLVNVPIGIFAFFLAFRLLPRHKRENVEKLDLLGAGLFMVTIVSLFVSLDSVVDVGFSNPFILLGFALSIAAFLVFLYVETHKENPLLQLEMFRNKLFTLSIFCGFISFVAMFCNNIMLPFYLQRVMNYSPQHSGFIMMIYPLVLTAVAPLSGYISDKIGSELLTFIGLVLASLGLLFMSILNQHSGLLSMTIYIALMSLGMGIFQSPNNSLVMSTVPREKLGVAGSINALMRNLGMSCGIALATLLLYGMMSKKIGYRVTDFVEGRNDVFLYGMKTVYITAGVLCLIGAGMTLLRIRQGLQKKKETVTE